MNHSDIAEPASMAPRISNLDNSNGNVSPSELASSLNSDGYWKEPDQPRPRPAVGSLKVPGLPVEPRAESYRYPEMSPEDHQTEKRPDPVQKPPENRRHSNQSMRVHRGSDAVGSRREIDHYQPPPRRYRYEPYERHEEPSHAQPKTPRSVTHGLAITENGPSQISQTAKRRARRARAHARMDSELNDYYESSRVNQSAKNKRRHNRPKASPHHDSLGVEYRERQQSEVDNFLTAVQADLRVSAPQITQPDHLTAVSGNTEGPTQVHPQPESVSSAEDATGGVDPGNVAPVADDSSESMELEDQESTPIISTSTQPYEKLLRDMLVAAAIASPPADFTTIAPAITPALPIEFIVDSNELMRLPANGICKFNQGMHQLRRSKLAEQANQTNPLVALPVELRDMIFELVFEDELSGDIMTSSDTPSLMGTCRLVFAEVLKMFLHKGIFRIHGGCHEARLNCTTPESEETADERLPLARIKGDIPALVRFKKHFRLYGPPFELTEMQLVGGTPPYHLVRNVELLLTGRFARRDNPEDALVHCANRHKPFAVLLWMLAIGFTGLRDIRFRCPDDVEPWESANGPKLRDWVKRACQEVVLEALQGIDMGEKGVRVRLGEYYFQRPMWDEWFWEKPVANGRFEMPSDGVVWEYID